jgi:hypothetical protein
MPSYSTVRRWEAENKEFQALSARAKFDGTHYLADEALVIADEPLASVETAAIDVSHRKLKIDTRLRLIGKWNRQDYGDKTLLGSDPDNPLPVGFDVRLLGSPLKQLPHEPQAD